MDFTLHFLRTVTELHIGCGQAVGETDLPVIRDLPWGLPYVPGSSLRGALRAHFPGDTADLFGSEPGEASIRPGRLSVLDCRLLLFPVPSDPGPFALVTSPSAIQRYQHDLGAFAPSGQPPETQPPELPSDEAVLVLHSGKQAGIGGRIRLDVFEFRIARADQATELVLPGLSQLFSELDGPVLLLPDEAFHYFTSARTGWRIRNQLSSSKVVETPFSVESVPPESWFYGLLGCRDPHGDGRSGLPHYVDLVDLLPEESLQDGVRHLTLGGHENVGLGMVQVRRALASVEGA